MTEQDGGGLWLTISELARERGISKQAVAKKVDRLAAHGQLETRPGPRGTRLVRVAQYDRAAGDALDAVRALNGETATRAGPADPILAKEQARRAAYAADLMQIDLEERLGKLMPVAEVRVAMAACAETIVRILDQVPARADEMAAAVARDGGAGARMFLKAAMTETKLALAEAMQIEALERAHPSAEVT